MLRSIGIGKLTGDGMSFADIVTCRCGLCCLLDTGFLLPNPKRCGPNLTVVRGGHQMTSRPEVAINDAIC